MTILCVRLPRKYKAVDLINTSTHGHTAMIIQPVGPVIIASYHTIQYTIEDIDMTLYLNISGCSDDGSERARVDGHHGKCSRAHVSAAIAGNTGH